MTNQPQSNQDDYSKYCIVTKYGPKGFKITPDMLGDLYKVSKKSGQTPMLIVSIPKSETQMYVLTCIVEIK